MCYLFIYLASVFHVLQFKHHFRYRNTCVLGTVVLFSSSEFTWRLSDLMKQSLNHQELPLTLTNLYPLIQLLILLLIFLTLICYLLHHRQNFQIFLTPAPILQTQSFLLSKLNLISKISTICFAQDLAMLSSHFLAPNQNTLVMTKLRAIPLSLVISFPTLPFFTEDNLNPAKLIWRK